MLPLRTNRLVLRDFVQADLPAYIALRSGVAFARHYAAEEMQAEFTAGLLQRFITAQSHTPRQMWQLAIVDQGERLLGSCGLRTIEPGVASFGCELGEAHWGQGYALEACRALLQFGATELAYHRILADTLVSNAGARRLAEALGFVLLPASGRGRHIGGLDQPVAQLCWTPV
ncbi:GNAT family N-acetyltransferase [Chitinimonas sp.]|uniref:GNAT family N-acetyltransferase n=1 Tax=Chitinimonas sp. TaxID=1934313 RepID=UPI0035B3720D